MIFLAELAFKSDRLLGTDLRKRRIYNAIFIFPALWRKGISEYRRFYEAKLS